MRTLLSASLLMLLSLGLPSVASAQAGNPDLLKFSGRADRAGDQSRTGSVRWEASFTESTIGPDLSAGYEVSLEGLLTELDGTPLVSIGGVDLAHVRLVAARGVRADQAKFEIPWRDRSGTRVRAKRRGGKFHVAAQVGRAAIAAPAACLLGADQATLRSKVVLVGPGLEPVSYSTTQNWKCAKRRSCDDCFALKAVRKSASGHGGHGGNKPPNASLRFENLTRDRETLNWIRLDARGSEDRDGTTVSYEFAVRDRRTGAALDAPGGLASGIAHVGLAPGDYEVTVIVTDNRGARDAETRRLSIPGEPIPNSGRLGVPWALRQDWKPGDDYGSLKHAAGLVDLAEIGRIFAIEPPEVTTTSRFAGAAASSGNPCGSAKSKDGFISGILSGALTIGGAAAAVMLGPEADFPLYIGAAGGASSVAGTSLSAAGGNAASSCMQQEIDNLADAVQFQGRQIQQMQNQLDLTDNMFFKAWQTAVNAEGDFYNDVFQAEFAKFSPTVTVGNPCLAATPDAPTDCTFDTPGLLGGFMNVAGLWESDTGPAIQGLCNVPGPEKGAISCAAGNELQSYENFTALQTWTSANSSFFQGELTALTGTDLGDSRCTSDVWKCLQYESGSILIETLEGLYANLLGNSGQLATAFAASQAVKNSGPKGTLSGENNLKNFVALIDAYNQALTFYIHQARTVIFEAFQMEWTVNNFNFYSNLPAGPVPNHPNTSPSVRQLGDSPATYFAGPTDDDYSCLNMSKYEQCVPGGFVCEKDAPLNTGGTTCNPSSPGEICGGAPEKCKYPSCKGNSAKCGVNAAAMSAPYNAAQLELAYLYAGRLNLLYELYLRYLVTDLPITGANRDGLQSWPTYTGTRYCSLPSTTVASGACANGGCPPQACTQDSDCASANCLDPEVDYEGLVATAAYQAPGTAAPRESQFVGQPIGWIQKANINFDSPPWSADANASYATNQACVANDGQSTSARVVDGQPGFVNQSSLICSNPDYPWCVGYTHNQHMGQCANTMPWTATGTLYQYTLKDPHTCRANITKYNRTTSDATPNLAAAIQSNDDCPSVFATPGGQAPRYGYFDGLTLQPYTFAASQIASDAQYGCPAECSSDTLTDVFPSTAEQQSMPCSPLQVTANGNTITATFEAQDSPCTDGCSIANTCSPLVGLVAGTCPSFVYQDPDSDVSYCVDTGWAQYKRTPDITADNQTVCEDAGGSWESGTCTAAALANCQACVSEPSLLLAGPMQGNVGACQAGTAGDASTGPKMDWYTPVGMDVTDPANLAMLCEGCTYLGCGNYQPLDTTKLPWAPGTTTMPDSLPTLFHKNRNCSSDGVGVPCTVASAAGVGCGMLAYYNGSHDDSIMSSVMVNDYRCGYVGGSGVSYIGVTKIEYSYQNNNKEDHYGQWTASLNSDAQNGSYPWGCGAFGFNTETATGSSGTTNYASLVFSNPNALTNLYEAVVTSENQHLAYTTPHSSFRNSGQQIGVSLVSQCSTNCGPAAPSLEQNTCLSVATQGNESSMYWLGYACSQGKNGESMNCYMNDGRAYSVGFPYGPGGLHATNAEIEASGMTAYNGIMRGLEFRQGNGACPAECANPELPGNTFGPLAANAKGECEGFLSPWGYCGGLCYNQPDLANDPSAQGPVAVSAPIDCRSCTANDSFGTCEQGYVPYAAGDSAGSACCSVVGESSDDGVPYKFLAFPYSSSNDTTADACGTGTVACEEPPCGTIQPDGSVLGTPPAAGTDACYPWGNTSMWPTWPFTY